MTRPCFGVVPLAVGLQWPVGGGFLFEEKLDGRWCERAVGRSVVVGELMRGGRFFAFDLVILEGQDIRSASLRDRLECLSRFSFPRPARGNGGEFLQAVLARGGEGVVAKRLDAPFGVDWFKCKRVETWDLLVSEKHEALGSLELVTMNGEPRGRCPARAMFDQIRVGDVVEVAAMCLTAKGKLREPRFVRVRDDKRRLNHFAEDFHRP